MSDHYGILRDTQYGILGTNLAEVGTDCISRQRAIDTVLECYDNDEVFEVFEDKLRALPAVPHWIPVTERLPEDSVYVLLTVRRMDDSYNHVPFISTGYISWNHQCWWCAHDGNCKDANIDVLAWMPLPKPFKGVTE